MATADKLITVAENVPRVYHAGQMNVVENAECLKGSKSGSAFLLDDISPVSHEMVVKISSDTVEDLTTVTVSKYGKNLFDFAQGFFSNSKDGTNYTTITIDNDTVYGIPALPYEKDIISIININNLIFVKPELNYVISCDVVNNLLGETTIIVHFFDKNENKLIPTTVEGETKLTWNSTWGAYVYKTSNLIRAEAPFKIPTNCAKIRFAFYVGKGQTLQKTPIGFSNIQLELNSTATDYEEYIMPTDYTPNTDGTVEGVTSLYPNTTLLTDTDGVIIDCNYYKDIDKAFNELSSAIALSGGE